MLAGMINYGVYITKLGDEAEDGARVFLRRPYWEAISERFSVFHCIEKQRIRRFGIVIRHSKYGRMIENRRPFVRVN